MTPRALAPVLLALLLGTPLAGQRPPQFRYERPVAFMAPGPQRLEIDTALIASGRPFDVMTRGERAIAAGGLLDLRFFTASGAEVPYLLVAPPVAAAEWVGARVLPIASTEKTSGFEADLGEVTAVDAMRLAALRAPYLKRFTLEASGDRERWTLLVPEGTAYHLPAEGMTQDAIEFPQSQCRYLRVTWDDTNSQRLAVPTGVAARRVAGPVPPGQVLRAPLAFERRPSEPGRSRFTVRLPGARLPVVALDLVVAGGHLLRQVRVVEAGLSGREAAPKTIGTATLRRVERNGLAADALRIRVAPPQEAQVELVVEDGDNPPIELQAVTAAFAELPWIYLESDAPGLVARWGDPELGAPRYDLEAAQRDAATARVTPAHWGAPTTLAPGDDDAPALPMPDTGAAIDPATFRYSRPLPPGRHGLITVPLDASALAHGGSLRNGFADLRVIDQKGRQVPYLLERCDGPLALDVGIARRDLPAAMMGARKAPTAYEVALPYDRLPGARLTVTTRARVFRRQVELAWLVAPDERRREPGLLVLVSQTWVHADESRPAQPLVFDLPEQRRGELVLVVDEGDNQPLQLERATLLLPAYGVRLFRPEGQSLHLVYGRPDLGAPEYDLALLAPQVLGRVAEEVPPGPEEDRGDPAVGLPSVVSGPVFWGALITAVVVLLAIIVRLAKSADEPAARSDVSFARDSAIDSDNLPVADSL